MTRPEDGRAGARAITSTVGGGRRNPLAVAPSRNTACVLLRGHPDSPECCGVPFPAAGLFRSAFSSHRPVLAARVPRGREWQKAVVLRPDAYSDFDALRTREGSRRATLF